MKALSLSTFLGRLIWLCVLPPVILAIYFAVHEVRTLQNEQSREAENQVRNIASDIDNRLQALILPLQVLAASSSVDNPARLSEFYNECIAFQAVLGVHVILTDTSKQMLLNTREPYGASLPKLPPSKGNAAAPAVLETGKPAVGDIVFGPVAKKPLVAVAVPVIRDDRVQFLLLSTIGTRQFQQPLDQISIPKGWVVTVFDGAGEVIARRSPPEAQRGSDQEEPGKSFVSRSAVSRWSVVLKVPQSLYRSQIVEASAVLGVVVLAVTVISVVSGRVAARRLTKSVAELAETPSLQASQPVITEIEAVRRKLFDSAKAREAAEVELLASERRYRDLYENAPDMYASVDARSGYVTQCNQTLLKVTGYSKDEVVGRQVFELYHPDSIDAAQEAFRSFQTTGEVNNAELQLRRKDGSKVYAMLNASAVYDENGKIAYSRSSLRDITERKKWEEEILKWSSVVQHAQWGVVYSDGDLQSLDSMNPAFAEMHGYTVEELSGRPIVEVFAPGERAALPLHIAMTHETGSHTWESKHVRKDGSVFPVLINATAVKDQEGRVLCRAVNVLDITEQKQAEQQLRESEERYRTVADFNYDWEYWVDTEAKFVYVSPSCERITSYSAQEFMDDPGLMRRIIHPDDLPAMLNHFNVARKVDYDQPHDLDFRIVRRDGETRWIAHACQPVYSHDGRPSGRRASNRDITDRKKVEEALRESEQRYRAVVDNLQLGISVINRNMEIVAVNPFFAAYYPNVREGEGEICHEMYNDPPRSSPCSYCPCVITFQDGKVHESETDTPVGGQIRHYRIVSCPVKDENGRVELVIELVEDVTERRALYAQLAQAQKMEAIGTLAGGVAHDFNNILQVALGYSELLLGDESLPDRCRVDLGKVYDSAKRDADLVQRLMTFSRKSEIKPQPLNLNRRITELWKMLERTVPKMIDIQLVLDDGLATINADPTQIDQILMNLAVNSRDAMPDGGKLFIETSNVLLDEEYAGTHLDAKPGLHVLLTVTDTGTGMDKDTLEHIFEPFYTTKAVGEGTGLGLAMVHGIVKQHGGQVRCYSEPGHGTAFRIYFPALVSDDEAEHTKVTPLPRGGSETILLVDDEELIRDLGSRVLTKAGYKVVTAANGKEAIEAVQVRADEISLVVLDLMMPEMGGKQCLAELLRIDPTAKVIIASGFSANGPTKDALEAGAKGFVNKPYDIRQLLEVVREVLDAQ